jgi:hypothetical protein
MTTIPPLSNHQIDKLALDLIAVFVAQGERSALRVAYFVTNLGQKSTPQEPLTLPPDFLHELAAALWLWDWERAGLTFHLDAGLPPADVAIEQALRGLGDPGRAPYGDQLMGRVMRVHLRHFAWDAEIIEGADVALDRLDPEAMLDSLAELLWANRHAGRSQIVEV